MEGDKVKDESELTSTMGNYLQASKELKSDDSTPTSSTDASTGISSQQIAVDDPISSTSSEVPDAGNINKKNIPQEQPQQTVESEESTKNGNVLEVRPSSIVSAKDLLDMNISDVSTEKIVENVDDIMQDLENLLGEPTTSFELPVRVKRSQSKEEEKSEEKTTNPNSEISAAEQKVVESNENITDPPTEQTEEIKTTPTTEDSPSCSSSTENVKVPSSNKNIVAEKAPEIGNEYEIVQVGQEQTNEAAKLKTENETETQLESKNIEVAPAETPIIVEAESAPSIAEAESTPSIVEAENTPSIVKAESTPSIVEAESTPSIAKAESMPSVVEAESTPSVVESESTLGVVESESTLSIVEAESAPSIVETESTLSIVEAESTPSIVEAESTDTKEDIDKKIEEVIVQPDQPKVEITPELSEENPNTSIIISESSNIKAIPENSNTEIQINEAAEELPKLASSEAQIEKAIEAEIKPKDEIDRAVEAITSSNDIVTIQEIVEATKTEESPKSLNEETEKESIPQIVTANDENQEGNLMEKEEIQLIDSSKSNVQEEPKSDDVLQVESNQKLESTSLISVQEESRPSSLEQLTELTENSQSSQEVKPMEVEESKVSEISQENFSHCQESEPMDVEDPGQSKSEEVETATITEIPQTVLPLISDTQGSNLTEPLQKNVPQEESEARSKVQLEPNLTDTCIETSEAKIEETMQEKLEKPSQVLEAEESAQQTVETAEPLQQATKLEELLQKAKEPEEVLPQTVKSQESLKEREESDEILQEAVKSQEAMQETKKPEKYPQHAKQLEEEEVKSQEGKGSEESLQEMKKPEKSPQHAKELDEQEVKSQQLLQQPEESLQQQARSEKSLPQIVKSEELLQQAKSEESIQPAVKSEESVQQAVKSEESLQQTVKTQESSQQSKESEALLQQTAKLEESVPQAQKSEELVQQSIKSQESKQQPVKPIKNLEQTVKRLQDSSVKESSKQKSDVRKSLLSIQSVQQKPIPEELQAIPIIDTNPVVEGPENLKNEKKEIQNTTKMKIEETDQKLLTQETQAIEDVKKTISNVDSSINKPEVITPPNEDQVSSSKPEPTLPQIQSNSTSLSSKSPVLNPEIIQIQANSVSSNSPSEEAQLKIDQVSSSTKSEASTTQITRKELEEPLVISVEDLDKERLSPKKSIKEDTHTQQVDDKEPNKGSLKMTITKQSNTMHSILKIYNPDENVEQEQLQKSSDTEPIVPKLIIKPVQCSEQHSPKHSKNSKQFSPCGSSQRSGSPRITIKPIVKPEESVSPLKLTIKPIMKPEQSPKVTIKPIVKPEDEAGDVSPKFTIKPIVKTEDEGSGEPKTYSPRVTIKPIIKPDDEVAEQKTHSPRVTIKPIVKPEESKSSETVGEQRIPSPKVTIKPIVKPDDNTESKTHSPRVTIKPIVRPEESIPETESKVHSPRVTIKPVLKPEEDSHEQKTRVTIKPIVKPEEELVEQKTGPRITIKPVIKPDELLETKHQFAAEPLHEAKTHSPRLTIKPIIKPDEEGSTEQKVHSPRVTIKPVVKPDENLPETKVHSPRITIKPIIKPEENQEVTHTRITIKPILKPESTSETTPKLTIKPVTKTPSELAESSEVYSPKITIKPIVKPQETELQPTEDIIPEEERERIVLKINVGSKPSTSRSEVPPRKEDEKLAKIKLKFSKEGGHPHIVQDDSKMKRPLSVDEHHQQSEHKKLKLDDAAPPHNVPPIIIAQSKLKEMLCQTKLQNQANKALAAFNLCNDEDVKMAEPPRQLINSSPIVISEESNQDSNPSQVILPPPPNAVDLPPPAQEVATIVPEILPPVVPEAPPMPPAPRKRGRPRKVPLQVREDFKDVVPPTQEVKPEEPTSSRPKRSCRGQSVRTTLGIKPRKPRGASRSRGSRRGIGSRGSRGMAKDKLGGLKSKLSLLHSEDGTSFLKSQLGATAESPRSAAAAAAPPTSTTDRADIVMYEEETRMSADTSSRAQTPAKQIVTTSSMMDIEESQSSVLSTATTESVKVRRGPRLEVQPEPEGSVISADQLAEYYWNGSGPYMLQEQVAQFLGIKSFKRKYPNIQRRIVDMQERDFIRESGLAGEAMCDLGLTAVNSADILDIMYSDFQDKYEEYCKHQRDRQAKDLTNKQRALSLAASQEKTKLDITQQAVQSAASWNANFNKTRKTQRKACMDLQTLTVHYPKGKVKQINKPKMGSYPVALVPGQFTDYYTEFSPIDLFRLPLNTAHDNPVCKFAETECDSQTDGSGSDSDSSSSDTDSSYSGSSEENCSLCKPQRRVPAAL